MTDITLPPRVWVDAYQAAGIQRGEQMEVQNKRTTVLLVSIEGDTMPDATSRVGKLLTYGRSFYVPQGAPACWVMSPGKGAEGAAFLQEM